MTSPLPLFPIPHPSRIMSNAFFAIINVLIYNIFAKLRILNEDEDKKKKVFLKKGD